MLVLIRDWLLAGVSSPWLPSRGGDCRGDKAVGPGVCVPGCAAPVPRPHPHLDVDLVAQHRCPQDHGFGTALELLAHEQGLLEGGAALVHVTGIQDLQGRRVSGTRHPTPTLLHTPTLPWGPPHYGDRLSVGAPCWDTALPGDHLAVGGTTLLWESMRALMSPSRMSCVSSSSSAATVVLKAVAILRMSADT